MRFGLHKKPILSHWEQLICLFFLLVLVAGCREDENISITFSKPSQGDNFNIGENINIKLDVPKNVKVDSVTYLVDGKLISKNTAVDSMSLPTANLPLGYRMISAIIKRGEIKDTLNTNIVLKTNRAPKLLTYKIVNTFPHDTSAYTEGLSYFDGKFLESTGEKGASILKYVDVKSGKALQQTKLEPQYFGEGSLKIGDKIIMLTWQENIGFIFDAKTFKQIGTFPYQNSREGWGLAFDGKNILRSDGSNRIWLMNPTTYKEESYIEVYDNKGPVNSINELEFINGKIYANVYLSNRIIIINPLTGEVESQVDLTKLVPQNFYKTTDEVQNNVLNGIAWDAKEKRMFVTGKKWPKMYQIEIAH